MVKECSDDGCVHDGCSDHRRNGPKSVGSESLATRECVHFSSGTTPATILTPETSPLCLREDEILLSTFFCDCQEVKGTHDSCLPRGEKKSLKPVVLPALPVCPVLTRCPPPFLLLRIFHSWGCMSGRMLAWHM